MCSPNYLKLVWEESEIEGSDSSEVERVDRSMWGVGFETVKRLVYSSGCPVNPSRLKFMFEL